VSTLSDIPYDEHRLVVVVALGFFALGAAVVPLRRLRVSSSELGAALVLVPAMVLVFAAAVAVADWAWAGESDQVLVPMAGVTCVFAWISGMQLRNGELRPRARALVIAPFLVVAAFLWTRDTPPPLGSAAAARAFDARPDQAGNRYVCRRYASGGDDQYGVSGAQFQCDQSPCRPNRCAKWFISFDGAGRVRNAVSPGGG
jgi:hypothetical protein